MTTFANLKTYAQDRYHDATDTKAVREVERFVNDAFRRISRAHDWSFYLTTGRVNTKVKYDTGTVAINTGDSQLILSGGTWPTDVATAYASVTLDSDPTLEFSVKTRTNGSALTFKDGQTWLGSNVSGVSYTLYYYRYDLPSDFIKMYDHEFQDFFAQYIAPTQFEHYHLTNEGSTGDPRYYTISGSKKIELWPYPSRSVAMDFLYYRMPTVLTSDSDVMDWQEDWIDLAHRGIDIEIAFRTKVGVREANSSFMTTLMELKSLDTGRQFVRRHHFNQGRSGSMIPDALIKRGGIS
tara:strand:+ start:234 stop:1118 length:885 start_codon:yes stop_codon:yes gene_type:complete